MRHSIVPNRCSMEPPKGGVRRRVFSDLPHQPLWLVEFSGAAVGRNRAAEPAAAFRRRPGGRGKQWRWANLVNFRSGGGADRSRTGQGTPARQTRLLAKLLPQPMASP
jgi:hypothetical protein